MKNCYVFQTKVGPIFIAKFPSHYQIIFDNKLIGSFDSPGEAAEALGNGQVLNPFEGAFRKLGTSNLEISSDLSEWECLSYE